MPVRLRRKHNVETSRFVVRGLGSMCVGFASAEGILWDAYDAPPFDADFQPRTVLFQPDSPPSSESLSIDPIVSADVTQDRNRAAEQQFREIKLQMVKLVNNYPETPAAKGALKWLNESGVRLIDGGEDPKPRRLEHDTDERILFFPSVSQ